MTDSPAIVPEQTEQPRETQTCALMGQVYFLASPTHVKIGFASRGVKKRIKEIRSYHYEKLELIAILGEVPMRVEKNLHKKFAAFRVGKGEWFRRVQEIEDFVENHRLGHWRKELLP